MDPEDPFARAGWYAWGILAVLAIGLVFSCAVSQAQDGKDDARVMAPDGPPPPSDLRCADGWCLVRQDTLRVLVEGLQKYEERTQQLEAFCGWRIK